MDKEAQEKVAEGMYFADRCQFCHGFGGKVEPYLCPRCVEKIGKLGYRKLPEGEPPLLSDEGEKCISALERIILQFRSSQTSDIRRFSLGGYIGYLGQRLTEIYDLRIKRDSDIKWYGL